MALFVSVNSELPDILTEKNTKVYQKGHKNDFFYGKMTSENFEVVILIGVWRILIIPFIHD